MSIEPLPFDDDAMEREWQLQERTLREERAHIASPDDDALTLRYRLLSRALRDLPRNLLPAEFAREMAQRADSTRGVDIDSTLQPLLPAFERTLLVGLIALFAAATGVAIALSGTLLQISDSALRIRPQLESHWLLGCLACLALCAVPWRNWVRAQRPR